MELLPLSYFRQLQVRVFLSLKAPSAIGTLISSFAGVLFQEFWAVDTSNNYNVQKAVNNVFASYFWQVCTMAKNIPVKMKTFYFILNCMNFVKH